MNLFVIYIGGETEHSLIELHDMRFIAANNIEDTYDELRKSWWGTPESLHLDCWGILKSADGYNIQLKSTPSQDNKKLYFVNLGGYDPNEFTEFHKNIFIVADDPTEAKLKAVKQVSHWTSPHRDYLHQIENIVSIQDVLQKKGLYLHLEATKQPSAFEFTCQYTPIGK